MPRKTLTSLKAAGKMLDEAIEDWQMIAEIKYEVAKDVFDAQDADTQATIKKMVSVLKSYATGEIKLDGEGVPVDPMYLDYTLFWLAVEIVKDLAFIGIRIENFEFPDTHCAQCGRELIPEKRSGRKAGRG